MGPGPCRQRESFECLIGNALQRDHVEPGPGQYFHAPVDRHEQVTDSSGVRLGIEVAMALRSLNAPGQRTLDPPEGLADACTGLWIMVDSLDGEAGHHAAEPVGVIVHTSR
jgi:hypothetical protein